MDDCTTPEPPKPTAPDCPTPAEIRQRIIETYHKIRVPLLTSRIDDHSMSDWKELDRVLTTVKRVLRRDTE